MVGGSRSSRSSRSSSSGTEAKTYPAESRFAMLRRRTIGRAQSRRNKVAVR